MINITREKFEEFLTKLKAKGEEKGSTQITWGVHPVTQELVVDLIIDGLKDSYCIYNLPNGSITFDRIWNGVL